MTTTVAPRLLVSTPQSAAARKTLPRWLTHRTLLILAGVTVVVLLAVFGGELKHRYVMPRNFSAVEPGRIFRSGQLSRQLVRSTLVEHRIGAIIFMSEDKADRPDVDAERATAAELGIERYNFPLGGDGVGNPMRYADAIEVMARCDAAGKPVLVHCHTGAQRTGGAVAIYRLLIQNQPGNKVYAELLEHGHDPTENPKMIPFLNQRMPEIARRLAERGVIPRVPEQMPAIAP